MRRIRFHPLAAGELEAAAQRCDRDRPGAGARFRQEVRGTLDRITTASGQGSPYLHGTRRFILQRFPYSNVYLTLDPIGHVVAIAHHKRRPGYWRRRLRDIH